MPTLSVYPRSSPQDYATSQLVSHLREQVIPPVAAQNRMNVYVGGVTAGAVDFATILAHKLPLFIGVVVLLSALLLMVVFRSLVIPLQAAFMNLLSIGASLGVIVVVFQWGWFDGIMEISKGPIESFIPVMLFAIVFGLSMDYEVFLVSRIHEQWARGSDAKQAVGEGLALTGRVVTAAAAIMICVFLSFMLGENRVIKEFGLSLASAVFLDARGGALPAAPRRAQHPRRAHLADPLVARPRAAAPEHRGRSAGGSRRLRPRGQWTPVLGRARKRRWQRRRGALPPGRPQRESGRLRRIPGGPSLALLLCLIASLLCGASTAAGAEMHPTVVLVFAPASPGTLETELPSLSTGLLSATQGTYTTAQFLLDLAQGARVSYSSYTPQHPPVLSLANGYVRPWSQVLARAHSAPQILEPGLLASSIPGGAAYVGVTGANDENGAAAANRGGHIVAVSLGSARRSRRASSGRPSPTVWCSLTCRAVPRAMPTCAHSPPSARPASC